MIISVASGKGGTGKTTVATNLAYAIGENVKILDCDVEEPNAHLFLKPEQFVSETAYTAVPQIDDTRCTYCRECVAICRYRAIAVVGKTVLTFPELCHSCGGCMVVCPEDAISEGRRELGSIGRGNINGIDFVNGRLKVGEAMSPPLIKKVRAYVTDDRINIIDAPPGTSCPVIAAMKGTHFVLMVTEPTPFGLHDLELAVDAVKLLKIPRGLVINRSDMGDDRVRLFAEKEKIPILMEIPFQREIAEAYSRGVLLSAQLPRWKTAFLELFHKIEDIVGKGESAR